MNFTNMHFKRPRLEPKESEVITPATRGCPSTRIADWKRSGPRKPVVNS